MVDGPGMSRAAQKKRKKLLKRKSCEINELNLPKYQSDSFHQDDDLIELDHDNENISSCKDILPGKLKKKAKTNNLFERECLSNKYLENLQEINFAQILNLKDAIEIEAKGKASLILSKMVAPTSYQEFYTEFWEKSILHNQVEIGNLFKDVFNKKMFRSLITENILVVEEDINVVSFNPSDNSNQLNEQIKESNKTNYLKYFQSGSALELLQPQKFSDSLWKFMSSLEFEFGSRISSTIIHQPQNHCYFEAVQANLCDNFVFQIDGSSTWRLISSETLEEQAPESIEIVLNQGDTLYFPKKYSASVIGDEIRDNLTIRFSTNFSNSVADILKIILPQALDSLSEDNQKFKKSIRPDIRNFISITASENDEDITRESIKNEFTSLLNQVMSRSMEMLDPASDQWAKSFIAERLPIFLSDEEEMHTAASNPNAVIFPYTQLRMVRPGVAIAVVEDGKVVLYHCMDNSRELFGNPLNPLEFEVDDGPSIEMLLNAYPNPITVSDLDHPSGELEDKIGVAQALYKEGFLVIADQISQGVEGEEDDDSDNPF